MLAISNPHGVSVGASAAVLAHVPACPARLQRIKGSVQAVLQQTPVTQNPVPHCDGVEHAPPRGTGVLVGVAVGVLVGVCVGVFVTVGVLVGVLLGVLVGVFVGVLVLVGVNVGVLVGVSVGVFVATGTPSMTPQLAKSPCPQVPMPARMLSHPKSSKQAMSQVCVPLKHC
jgi:hypothetical protein